MVVFARRVTVAEVTVMGATCVGLMEEVDALGGDVRGPVEERPDIKVIERCSSRKRPENKVFERCSFKNWYMVRERGPVEGRPGIKSPAGTIRTPQEVHRRRCSPNNTGVRGTTQGGRLVHDTGPWSS